MLRIVAILSLLAVMGCTAPEVEYCRSFGVEGTPEYGKCLNYYNQQEQLFGADRAVCALEADRTYPPTLYDRGGFARVRGGGAFWGGYPGYYGHPGTFVQFEPDYHHNAEVDRLRLRIIGPCMQSRGWNSPTSWQAGRSTVKPATKPKVAKPGGNTLPWLK